MKKHFIAGIIIGAIVCSAAAVAADYDSAAALYNAGDYYGALAEINNPEVEQTQEVELLRSNILNAIAELDYVPAKLQFIKNYLDSGLYYEANDELNWLKSSHFLGYAESRLWDEYSGAAAAGIKAVESVSSAGVADKLVKIKDYLNRGLYYEARDELVWLKNYNTLSAADSKLWGEYYLDAQTGADRALKEEQRLAEAKAAAANGASYAYVEGEYVKKGDPIWIVLCNECISLRDFPSTSGKVITEIPLYSGVKFISDIRNGFYYVTYNNQSGFIDAKYAGYYEPQCFGGYAKVVNCRQSITLRTSASTSGREIMQVPLNATVIKTFDAPRNGFQLISYNGQNGWVLKSYLKDIPY